ncbi:MAG: DNA polymerase III subunit delta [Planctomycetia bacterium]|nr:DNA polymerase III subunit delta [Planctomycetia bacterium]
MAGAVSALDFLAGPGKYPASPVTVLAGDDSFLLREAARVLQLEILPEEDAEFSLTVYEKGDPSWLTVVKEVSTVAMFGGALRLVRVEQADAFVSRYRDELDAWLEHPAASGILVLVLKSFPANTTLYKKVAKSGLIIDCRAPASDVAASWLVGWAKSRHDQTLTSDAAKLLVELVGDDLGLLSQEIARLALLTGSEQQITESLVAAHVGSWRTKKTWDMLDAALDGHLPEALRQLDLLFAAKADAIGILAQIAPSLRKLANATRIFLESERNGLRLPLATVLEQAGINRFFLRKYEGQLQTLGRFRGKRILPLLVETDLALKGDSRMPPRILIERLLVELAHNDLRNVS